MKPLRLCMGLVLLSFPFVAWAQTEPPEPPNHELGATSEGPIIAGQVQSEISRPPHWIQRKLVTQGGPDNPMFTPMNPELGMGLGAWWKNSEIVSKVQLSDEQVRKISQTFLDHKLKLIDLQADLEKQELRLQPLMDLDQPDESKVGTQIDMITAARGRLEKENAMMMLDIRRWLSVEQWKKLKSLEAAEEGKHNFFYLRTGPRINIDGPPPPLPPDDMPVIEKH
jgi:protein CpxP